MLDIERFEEWIAEQPSDVERASALEGWKGAMNSAEFHKLQADFKVLELQRVLAYQNESIRSLLELCLRLSEQVCKK